MRNFSRRANVVTSLICLARKRSIPRNEVDVMQHSTFPPRGPRQQLRQLSRRDSIVDPLGQSPASSVQSDRRPLAGIPSRRRSSGSRCARPIWLAAWAYRRRARPAAPPSTQTHGLTDAATDAEGGEQHAFDDAGGSYGGSASPSSWFGALASKTVLFCGKPTNVSRRNGDRGDMGSIWAHFPLQRHLAAGHQHRHDDRQLSHRVSDLTYAKSRYAGSAAQDSMSSF